MVTFLTPRLHNSNLVGKEEATDRGDQKRSMEEMLKLTHLLVTVFLYTFATMTAFPAIPDVTMSALCPGRDECSLAIYFTGFQQVVSFCFYSKYVFWNEDYNFWIVIYVSN